MDRDDTLIGSITIVDRDGAVRALGKFDKVGGRYIRVDRGHTTNLEIAGALHHQHPQCTTTLQLQCDCTIKFKALCDQASRCGGVAQRLCHQRIVVVVALQASPRTRQMNQRTTHGQRFKRKRCNAVA